MTTAKKPAVAKTWSDSETAQLVERYKASGFDNSKLDSLMAGKTAAQCRSKLVSLGEYRKAEPAAKTSADVESSRKSGFVKAIEILASLPAGSLASLEKAAKPELQKLAEALTLASERVNVDQAAQLDMQAQYAATMPEGEEIQTSGM
jgi:hypothetical protein